MKRKNKYSSVLGLIGYADFANHLLDIFTSELSPYSLIRVFDDKNPNPIKYPRLPFNNWDDSEYKDDTFLIAVGYKHLKSKTALIKRMILKKRRLLTLRHKASIVAKSATISPGCIIFPGGCIDSRVHLESGVIVHNGCILSHDVTVGIGSFIAPGVVICGNCKIGKGCFLGAGSILQNGVRLPDYTVVGMGEKVFRKKYYSNL